MSMPDAADRFRALLDDAVRMSLRSDVPVTLFLSGGIDSSLIAESAVRQGHLSTAYCLDFPVEGYSEAGAATAVARSLGIELRRVSLSSDALADFADIVGHADDPLGDSSALAVWTLARAVARDYKVAISGDGGDELFGGYVTYKATDYHRRLISRLPSGVRRFLARSSPAIPVTAGKVSTTYQVMRFLRAADLSSAEAHMTWNGTWLPKDAARLANPAAHDAAIESLRRIISAHGIAPSGGTQAMLAMDSAEYLCNDILVKVDRMTMAHGIEARAPLLTPALADFAFALPEHLKLRPVGRPKRLLREMVRRVYGEPLASARKQGFSIPIHTWLRGPARALAESLLSPNAVTATGLLNEREVSAAWSAHKSGRAQLGFELWGLMVLVAWYQARITSRPVAGASGLRRIVLPLLGRSASRHGA
jgi:asparagine synthase (glutamine-hydrolysing)